MKHIIFTDLDGTLLDHHSYDWSPATDMLNRLENAGIPVIYTTSKTQAELAPFRRETGNMHAAIAENGGAWYMPANWAGTGMAEQTGVTAASRADLLSFIDRLPSSLHRHFNGFHRMGDDGVAAATGLSPEKARQANDRQCSEPFLWNGTAESLDMLRQQAANAGYHILQGGRFYHLQSRTDKRDAMTLILQKLAAAGQQPVSIALGDGPNDILMLEAADIAISIPNHDGVPLSLDAPLKAGQQRLVAPEPGPAGWAKALSGLELV